MIEILQINVEKADTLNQIQAEIAEIAHKIANTPTDVLIKDLVDSSVSFGLKVLAALVIYYIGAWLIRKIRRIIENILERKKTDPAITSFILSIATIAMTIVLIIDRKSVV